MHMDHWRTQMRWMRVSRRENEWEGQQGDVERLPDSTMEREGWRRRRLILGIHNRVCKRPEQRVRQGTGKRKRESGRCMRALRRARRWCLQVLDDPPRTNSLEASELRGRAWKLDGLRGEEGKQYLLEMTSGEGETEKVLNEEGWGETEQGLSTRFDCLSNGRRLRNRAARARLESLKDAAIATCSHVLSSSLGRQWTALKLERREGGGVMGRLRTCASQKRNPGSSF